MAAIQRADETFFPGKPDVAPTPLAEADGRSAAFPSPAKVLQEALAARYGLLEDIPDPVVDKWPGWLRAACLAGSASASWGLLICGVALLRR